MGKIKLDQKTVKEIIDLEEHEFITFLIDLICKYAKASGYKINETIKKLGINIAMLSDIANFENYK